MTQRRTYYYLIEVQYLGFRYHGWAKQPNVKTVQGMINRTLKFILGDLAFKTIQAGVVLPSEEHVSVRGAIVQHSLEVRRNGESLGVARAEELLADALANLRLLVELLAEFGIRLEKGQLLLTGSPLPLYRVTGGDRVEVLSSHLGEVRASVGHEPTAAGSPSSQVGQ